MQTYDFGGGIFSMLLSAVVEEIGATLVRDGSFTDLGFVTDTRQGMLSFAEDHRFLPSLCTNPNIAAAFVGSSLVGSIPDRMAVAVSEVPRLAFAHIHNRLCEESFYGDHVPTEIHPDARVHPSAWIAEKNVRVGAGTSIGPRAIVLERCRIGEHCVIGAGCVLGGVGLQTVKTGGSLLEMRHAGGLLLGDRVHVLPGAVLATGLFRHSTEIGNDARIGSQAFVSHAVRVGRESFIGHGSVVNGNVSIGEGVWVGPGAVIAHRLNVGDGATVSLGAVVIRDVDPETRVSGNFAEPHRALLRRMAAASSKD